MEKLILIDGNSLLNRAYYAMTVFSTKDGLPTNGIFGFIKLLFKIIEEERPKYLIVAFDLHAPTFRHKLYPQYKGTRKPMPEELVQQVPVLKETLASMGICMVEKEGYEADDLIGTITRTFNDVEILIYTGDRDAYQLIKENVSVCYTKRGVSDIDRITAENFERREGLEPWQVVELKSLMGDPSDNIPGVRGIGPKTAKGLLQTFGSVQEIYDHLEKTSVALRDRLIQGREDARLSHTLAKIDTAVPISLCLEDCRLRIPFPEKARTMFARLEFRSLINTTYFPKRVPSVVRQGNTRSIDEMIASFGEFDEFAICLEKEGCYLYLNGREMLFPVRNNFLEPGFFLDELKPLFQTLLSRPVTAYVSDYKAFMHRMAELGVNVSCRIEDVTLLRYLSDSNLRPRGAKELAKDFDLSEEDCAFALKLAYDEAKSRIAGMTEERLYRELELPLADVLYDMERTGVRVDHAKFSFFSEKYGAELEEVSKKIYALAGVSSFNLNSPFQLSEVLFEKLGYSAKGIKRNHRGGYSTSAEVLEHLAEEHEIARLILRYREIQKLLSTYIDGIRPLVVNGIVHTTYNQTMTTTGRLSSANPNLQNIPVRTEEGRELRKLFIAREGNILIDADYSQIELRLLAHFSGCQSLIQAYNEGKDIHAETASQVFGVPLGEVTPLQRRRAKSINFGIIYGISSYGLSKDLSCTPAEAQQYIDLYFRTYSDVREYMDENVRTARQEGYVTTILGRRRYIGELRSSNYNLRSFGERAAMNMPLQGSAADIIKIAMINVFRRLSKEGLRAKMVLQVHDELVLDTPLEEAERAKVILKEEMERAFTLRVPLIAEVTEGKSWYDAK